jgi:capsular polysaccharide biosynthesis protein
MYKLAPFMKNMLEIMGIDSERVHELGERAVIRVGNLTIESSMAEEFSHPCQQVNRELIEFVEKSLSPTAIESKAESVKRNIYLSRNKYEGRRISNESNLLKILEKHGFQTVYPEELSVAEQISLFKNADVIVSPHGASLANIIFCKNVTLIEIFNQNYGTPTFYLVAKLLDFHYQHILGTNPLLSKEEQQNVGLANLQYEDMEVDLDKLEQCLTKVFANSPSTLESGAARSFFKGILQRLTSKFL